MSAGLDLDALRESSEAFGQGRWRDPAWGPIDAWATPVSAHQYRPLFRLVEAHVPAGGRVYEWGSGSCRFAYCLLSAGYQVAAGDLERPPLLAELRAVHGDRFEYRDLEPEGKAIPWEDEAFDAVTSVGVLEHVRETGGDEATSLREIRRVLRPGGVFLCVHLPNQTSWIDWAARRGGGDHAHDVRYTRAEVERLVAEADLDLLELHRYGVLPRNRASRLPAAVSQRPAGVRAFDAADAVLGVPLRPLAQNWAFAARKPS